MIRVLIVNDSPMAVQYMRRIIQTDTEMKVAGVAYNGIQAIQEVKELKPDVVLMDINMPEMDGTEATRRIMQSTPVPILVVTASLRRNMSYIFECMKSGALEVIKTPSPDADVNVFIRRIKVVSQLKNIIRSRSKERQVENTGKTAKAAETGEKKLARRIVAVGASAGGPAALQHLFQGFSDRLQAGVVLVQHIDCEFVGGLAEWFNTNGSIRINTAKNGDRIFEDFGYIAGKEGHHLIVSNQSLSYITEPSDTPHTPSIDVMFESVARIFGDRAIGVLLTGMGNDGAKGLKKMREAGARTIAQDKSTSVVYGMPKAAAEIGGAELILPLDKIAPSIMSLLEEA